MFSGSKSDPKSWQKLLHQKSCTSIVHLPYLISAVKPIHHTCTWDTLPTSLPQNKHRPKENCENVFVKSIALEYTSLSWTDDIRLKQILRCDIFGRPSDPAGSKMNTAHVHYNWFIHIPFCTLVHNWFCKITCSHRSFPKKHSKKVQLSSSPSLSLWIFFQLSWSHNWHVFGHFLGNLELGFQRNFMERFSLCCT